MLAFELKPPPLTHYLPPPPCMLAFEQKPLPLAIKSIQPASSALADIACFPPSPVPPGTPPPPGAAPLRFTIQFESSGKWPDSNGLIASLVAC